MLNRNTQNDSTHLIFHLIPGLEDYILSPFLWALVGPRSLRADVVSTLTGLYDPRRPENSGSPTQSRFNRSTVCSLQSTALRCHLSNLFQWRFFVFCFQVREIHGRLDIPLLPCFLARTFTNFVWLFFDSAIMAKIRWDPSHSVGYRKGWRPRRQETSIEGTAARGNPCAPEQFASCLASKELKMADGTI